MIGDVGAELSSVPCHRFHTFRQRHQAIYALPVVNQHCHPMSAATTSPGARQTRQ